MDYIIMHRTSTGLFDTVACICNCSSNTGRHLGNLQCRRLVFHTFCILGIRCRQHDDCMASPVVWRSDCDGYLSIRKSNCNRYLAKKSTTSYRSDPRTELVEMGPDAYRICFNRRYCIFVHNTLRRRATRPEFRCHGTHNYG